MIFTNESLAPRISQVASLASWLLEDRTLSQGLLPQTGTAAASAPRRCFSHRRDVGLEHGKTIGKTRKTRGKSGKTMENLGKLRNIWEKPWENLGKLWEIWENYGTMMWKTSEHYSHKWRFPADKIMDTWGMFQQTIFDYQRVLDRNIWYIYIYRYIYIYIYMYVCVWLR